MKEFRDLFFIELGKTRFRRVITCIFLIGLVWNFADALNGSFSFNPLHDIICLILGVVVEFILPWGKRNSNADEVEKLIKTNKTLVEALSEANDYLTATVEVLKERTITK